MENLVSAIKEASYLLGMFPALLLSRRRPEKR